MRGLMRNAGRGVRRAALLGAVAMLASLAACGDDDDCTHVLSDVPSLEACKQIAEERMCSVEIVYSMQNDRCKVQKCGDCDGRVATPTVTPEPEA